MDLNNLFPLSSDNFQKHIITDSSSSSLKKPWEIPLSGSNGSSTSNILKISAIGKDSTKKVNGKPNFFLNNNKHLKNLDSMIQTAQAKKEMKNRNRLVVELVDEAYEKGTRLTKDQWKHVAERVADLTKTPKMPLNTLYTIYGREKDKARNSTLVHLSPSLPSANIHQNAENPEVFEDTSHEGDPIVPNILSPLIPFQIEENSIVVPTFDQSLSTQNTFIDESSVSASTDDPNSNLLLEPENQNNVQMTTQFFSVQPSDRELPLNFELTPTQVLNQEFRDSSIDSVTETGPLQDPMIEATPTTQENHLELTSNSELENLSERNNENIAITTPQERNLMRALITEYKNQNKDIHISAAKWEQFTEVINQGRLNPTKSYFWKNICSKNKINEDGFEKTKVNEYLNAPIPGISIPSRLKSIESEPILKSKWSKEKDLQLIESIIAYNRTGAKIYHRKWKMIGTSLKKPPTDCELRFSQICNEDWVKSLLDNQSKELTTKLTDEEELSLEELVEKNKDNENIFNPENLQDNIISSNKRKTSIQEDGLDVSEELSLDYPISSHDFVTESSKSAPVSEEWMNLETLVEDAPTHMLNELDNVLTINPDQSENLETLGIEAQFLKTIQENLSALNQVENVGGGLPIESMNEPIESLDPKQTKRLISPKAKNLCDQEKFYIRTKADHLFEINGKIKNEEWNNILSEVNYERPSQITLYGIQNYYYNYRKELKLEKSEVDEWTNEQDKVLIQAILDISKSTKPYDHKWSRVFRILKAKGITKSIELCKKRASELESKSEELSSLKKRHNKSKVMTQTEFSKLSSLIEAAPHTNNRLKKGEWKKIIDNMKEKNS